MSRSKERSTSRAPSSSSSPRRSPINSTPSSTAESIATAPEFQPTSAEASELERELAELDRRGGAAGADSDAGSDEGVASAWRDALPAFLLQSKQEIKEKYEDLEWTQRELFRQHARALELNRPYGDMADVVATRNRYMNVDAYFHNRVLLKVPPEHPDYINASPITLKRYEDDEQPSTYIATQGPKEDTIGHFWHMVWEETPGPTAIIVMLTRVVELGKIKCYDYLARPDNEPIAIYLDAYSSESPAYFLSATQSKYDDEVGSKVSELELKNERTGETKRVLHYAFEEWPDFSVPEGIHRKKLARMIYQTQELSRQDPSSPRIVHCSAGVGRTGSYMAMDFLLRMLHEGRITKSSVPQEKDLVHDTVETLRRQRMMMIQGEAQYALIYNMIKEEMGRLLDEGVLEREG